MIEKVSVYFGQFLVVKTEEMTASLAGSVFGNIRFETNFATFEV